MRYIRPCPAAISHLNYKLCQNLNSYFNYQTTVSCGANVSDAKIYRFSSSYLKVHFKYLGFGLVVGKSKFRNHKINSNISRTLPNKLNRDSQMLPPEIIFFT